MKPFVHAMLSQKRYNKSWESFIGLHDFFDSTKSALPDVRHRAVLHNNLGIELASMIFGQTIEGISTNQLSTDHNLEDLGKIYTLNEWLEGVMPTPLKRIGKNFAKDATLHLSNSHRISTEQVQKVVSILELPQKLSTHESAGVILQNSFGIYICERVLGHVLIEGKRIVSVRDVAEDYCINKYGKIFSLEKALENLHMKPWMSSKNIPKEYQDMATDMGI